MSLDSMIKTRPSFHVRIFRDMCCSEDVEVQTSALKIRDEGTKKKCC